MPVRKIPMNHRSLTGQIADRARGGRIAVESALERDFALLHLFDRTVRSIEEQPVRIDYEGPDGRGLRYTPDFLVGYHSPTPARLVEVKYQADLDRNADLYDARFRAAHAYAAARGWTFEVVTEAVIRIPRLENARFLLPFQKRRFAPDLKNRFTSVLATVEQATIEGLLDRAVPSSDRERAEALAAVWHLLSVGAVLADLDQALSMSTILRLSEGAAHVR